MRSRISLVQVLFVERNSLTCTSTAHPDSVASCYRGPNAARSRLGTIENDTGLGGLQGGCIELQSQPIGQPRQVVEYPHDMRDFQARPVIESEIAQRLPVAFDHARRRGGQLLRHRCEGPLAFR